MPRLDGKRAASSDFDALDEADPNPDAEIETDSADPFDS
jgi:hypothetical protein